MTNQEKLNNILLKSRSYVSELRANKLFNDSYQTQAIQFLIDTDTKIDIEPIGKVKPPWGDKSVNSYAVTLKTPRGEYTFDYYDSIHNTEKGQSAVLDFYGILSCLDLDYSCDFDDFCANYGYDFKNEREYIKVKQAYLAVRDQDAALRRIFTSEQLEQLNEIN